jgi:hypothetical protein
MSGIDIPQFTDEAKMLRHCAPIFFVPAGDARPSAICASATVALLDAGLKKLLVTCFHVWDEFLDYRASTPSACLCTVFVNGFGPPVVVRDEALVDSDPGVDLAIFQASPEEWDMGCKEFYRIERWPIPNARVGDPIAFIGFRGAGRYTSHGVGNFTYSAFGLSVSDVSDRKLVIAGGSSDKRSLWDNNGNAISPISMGGLSGSPAYVRTGTEGFLLAGFVQMGRTSSDDIFLTNASVLNRDGTLRR